MAQSQTLHALTAVRVDAGGEVVVIEGQLSNRDPFTVTMHRRVLGGLIGSLIQAHGSFPKGRDKRPGLDALLKDAAKEGRF